MVEIMTDKATVEIPSPRAGRVAKLMYAEGQICPVGKVLIVDRGRRRGRRGDAAAPRRRPRARGRGAARRRTGEHAPRNNGVNARDAGVLATPATRKLARDVGRRHPRGDRHRAGRAGHLGRRARPRRRAAPAARRARGGRGDTRIPFRGVRRKIAEHLVHSKHTAAHFTYVEEIDCTELVALRERANARLRPRRAKRQAVVPALHRQGDGGGAGEVSPAQRHPRRRGRRDRPARAPPHRPRHRDRGRADRAGRARRGSAVDRRAGRARSSGWRRSRARARRRARSSPARRSRSPAWARWAGCWRRRSSIIPRSRSWACTRSARRPAVADDSIVIRDLMNLSISVDHRVVDGYDAARFIAEIKATLEAPGPLYPEAT